MTESPTPPPGSAAPASSPPPAPPPPAPPAPQQYWMAPPPRRRRPLWKRLLIALVVVACIFVALSLIVGSLAERIRPGGMDTTVLEPGGDDQIVAVLKVGGIIGDEAAEAVARFCRHVRNDSNVKAVVVRVDSPGGYMSPCDRARRHLSGLRSAGKTLIVSMGGVAASGGYYVSAPAEEIFAEPTTITGSIGVIGGLLSIKGTMEKIGVKTVIMRSTKTRAWKAAPSSFEEPTDYQLKNLQAILDAMQEQFEKVVIAGRGNRLKTTTAEKTYLGADKKEFTVIETEPFNGKVFLVREAIRLGLVDKEGYLEDATAAAASRARLSDPKVVLYKVRKGLLERIGLAGVRKSLRAEKLLDQLQTPRIMMIWKVSP